MTKSITYEVTVDQRATKWTLNGKLHREDGPAIEYASGTKCWYINGMLHREDGPAIERADGDKFWYINDKLHRTDGPACEYANGDKDWYIDDRQLTEGQFNQRTQPAVEMTIAEIEAMVGKRVKIVK